MDKSPFWLVFGTRNNGDHVSTYIDDAYYTLFVAEQRAGYLESLYGSNKWEFEVMRVDLVGPDCRVVTTVEPRPALGK